MILKNFSLVPELSGGLDGRGLAMELKDGKIAALFADTEPVAETAFDCGGRTLLPGFLDIHTHLNGLGRDRDADVNVPMKVLVTAAELARHYLDYGFTTIRDCGGRRFETLAVRDYINKGKLIGPRMLCSGTPLKVVGGHEPGADYTGPWEARARVREFLMHGVDFLKVMVTGGLGKAGEDPGCVEPTQEELDAIVSEAKKHGKKVACHCHSRQGMEMLVKAGADSVEHSTYLDADVDKLLIENGVYVVPTFLPYMNYALLGEQEHQLMDTVLAARAIVDEKKRRFKEAFDLGVKVAFGRDSGGFMMDQERAFWPVHSKTWHSCCPPGCCISW